MIWKSTTLLDFNSDTKEWSKRKFETYNDYLSFVKSCYKYPGQYNLRNTEHIREMAIRFEKTGKYCDYQETSKEYKEFWLTERRKCVQGVIFDNVLIPGSLYMWWNYLPIFNKLEMRPTLPEIWDSHLFYSHYLELAWLLDKDGCCVKSRQKGISLYHMARLTNKIWFGNAITCRVIGYEEEYILLEWGIMQNYRNHLNEHTGWYRSFNPDESLNWEQKIEVTEGTLTKKRFTKGNKCRIKGGTTKKNIAKAVGGAALEVYATEAGIYQNLKKVKEYLDPNIKMGAVKVGMFVAAGAVGELREASDLQEFAFNPNAYGFLSVPDTFSGTGEPICFFYPDSFNYVYKDEENGEVVKCYDKDGNSDIKLADKYLDIEEAKAKQKDETSFKLFKSQHCRTLQDAFDQREDNPFPTHLLKEREQELITKKFNIVSFFRDEKGKPKHKFSDDVPVIKLKPNPGEDNRGAVVIKELPMDKSPFGLYYAGVDPIFNVDTSTSRSLMSIVVWIGYHEKGGKICEPYPVAWYTGRHKKTHETYQVCLDLIEFYNARAAIENNVKDFIEWMIRQGKSRYCMTRRELTVINEMMPNSTIRDEIGIRMETQLKARAMEKMVHWTENVCAVEFNMETGEGKDVHNVSKIGDIMWIREMLRYNPKLNTDRNIANLCALIAIQSDSNRHIINEVDFAPKDKPKNVSKSLPSPFKSGGTLTAFKKMPSPFYR